MSLLENSAVSLLPSSSQLVNNALSHALSSLPIGSIVSENFLTHGLRFCWLFESCSDGGSSSGHKLLFEWGQCRKCEKSWSVLRSCIGCSLRNFEHYALQYEVTHDKIMHIYNICRVLPVCRSCQQGAKR